MREREARSDELGNEQERLETFKEIITQSFLILMRVPPEDSRLAAMAMAWDDLLHDVKVKHLKGIYEYAMKARPADQQSRPVTASEMRFVVDQRRRGLIYAKSDWRDATLYDEDGNYHPTRLVM